jgi:hypothetical protein
MRFFYRGEAGSCVLSLLFVSSMLSGTQCEKLFTALDELRTLDVRSESVRNCLKTAQKGSGFDRYTFQVSGVQVAVSFNETRPSSAASMQSESAASLDIPSTLQCMAAVTPLEPDFYLDLERGRIILFRILKEA